MHQHVHPLPARVRVRANPNPNPNPNPTPTPYPNPNPSQVVRCAKGQQLLGPGARLEHRIGGLEKWDVTGHISYDPDNHHHMCELRADKIERMQVPDIKLNGPEEGDLLVVSWGGTYGSVITAAEQVRAEDGAKISVAHLRSLNPFPKNLEEILGRFKKVIVPELNLGQLHMLLRARFLVDAISYPKIKGRPFQVGELTAKFREVLGG